MNRNSTPSSAKVSGWFFYVALLTKRKNECKQCQKEYAEGQHILKIEMIFHRHHPHSVKMEGQPTLQHDCSMPIIYHNPRHITTFFSISHCPGSPSMENCPLALLPLSFALCLNFCFGFQQIPYNRLFHRLALRMCIVILCGMRSISSHTSGI